MPLQQLTLHPLQQFMFYPRTPKVINYFITLQHLKFINISKWVFQYIVTAGLSANLLSNIQMLIYPTSRYISDLSKL